jgi:hypothetical protein
MKLRCSPYNPAVFVVCIGILIFFHTSFASAQCQGEFTYQVFSTDQQSSSGKIEVDLKNSVSGTYTLKVYKIDGVITLVQTQKTSDKKITIDNLAASTYLIRIEWGGSCYTTIGGLDGIIVTLKDQ